MHFPVVLHELDSVAFALAADQHGAFGRWQLGTGDDVDSVISRRLREGRWRRARPGVYVLAGLPPDPERDVWAAWLAVGSDAVASFELAGARHRLWPITAGRLVFTTTHGDHHRLDGIVVHQLRDLLPHHVTTVDGLPTTTLPRTVVDLAAVSSPVRLRKLVEFAVTERGVSETDIGGVLREVARPGKRGARRLTRELSARAPGDPVPDSVLERLLLGAVLGAGNPRPVAQLPHPGRHPARGCVDFGYPAERLLLEADGRRWHQRIADLQRDRARDNEAARAGWLTMRFMWEELQRDPDDVGRAVLETRAHRAA